MPSPVRALAGILHVGEPSLPRAIASLESQVGVDLDLHLIGHEPKWEAHRQLFERFDADAGAHDVLIKVDADMELVHPGFVRSIGQLFRRFRHIDHAVIGVDDWFSGERIMGLTAWRGGTRWTTPPSDLFTDLAASTAREKFKLIDPGFPLVLHGADPSDEQAFRYGAHRALKAAASRRGTRLDRLEAFARFAVEAPEEGRLLALAAAVGALDDERFGRRCTDGDTEVTHDDRADLRQRIEDPAHLLESLLDRTSRLREVPGAAPGSASAEAEVTAEITADDTAGDIEPGPGDRRPSARGFLRRVRGRLRRRVADQATMAREFTAFLAT